MRLNSFGVQKYRSIQKALKLPLGDLTVLIGPNNEGKSNLLRALVLGTTILSELGSGASENGVGRSSHEGGSF